MLNIDTILSTTSPPHYNMLNVQTLYRSAERDSGFGKHRRLTGLICMENPIPMDKL